jgi:nucleoside-triphosphatase
MTLENEILHRPRIHLITGSPGAGKTTAVKALASALPPESIAGFFTEEIRESGSRQGFRAITFSGKEMVMAHVSFKSGPRVGKYRVDIPAFDKIVVPEIDPSLTSGNLFVIDEIGKMECFSDYFVQCVRGIVTEGKEVVAAVALKGAGLIEEIKKVPGADLHTLDRTNRDHLPDVILQELR